MKLQPNTITGKLRARLEEIKEAIAQNNTHKSIWEALKKEGYIDCSYTVYANTIKRLTGKKGDKREVKEEKKATENHKKKVTLEGEKTNSVKPIKQPFKTKPTINMSDFED